MTAAPSLTSLLAFSVSNTSPHTHTRLNQSTVMAMKTISNPPIKQLNLTPALTLLRHSRSAVGKQKQPRLKKRFNFRHTEVQFCHAYESDNYPRSTEILQINQ